MRRLLLAIFMAYMAWPASAQEAKSGFAVRLLHTVPGKRAALVPHGFFEYQAAPGDVKEDTIEITNVQDQPITLQAYPADCFNDEYGQLKGNTLDEKAVAVGTWLQIDTTPFTLQARERKRLAFKLAIPPVLAAGDQLGFLFVQPIRQGPIAAPKGENLNLASPTLKVEHRVGVVVVAHVDGTTGDKPQVGLPAQGPGAVNKIVQGGKLSATVAVSNPSRVFLKPRATWKLTDGKGLLIAREDWRPLGHVLPGRPILFRIPLTLQRPLARGRYFLEVQVQDVRDPQIQANERYEIGLP